MDAATKAPETARRHRNRVDATVSVDQTKRRWPIALRRARPVSDQDSPPTPPAEDTAAVREAAEELQADALYAKLQAANGQADSLRIYLQDINEAGLLTAEDEIALAQAIEAGLQAREALESESARPHELAELKRIADAGHAARDRLIRSNLRLVVATARRYMTAGCDLGDLIQEGNLGLMKAVDRFDWRKGNRFSTYALWWIRQAITTAAVDSTRCVRIPTHVVDSLGKLSRTEQRLAQELGRQPTDGEVGDAMGISEVKLADLKLVRERPSSLDVPVGEDGECELGDLVEDVAEATPISIVMRGTLRQEIKRALDTLTIRERQVVWLRFGLGDDTPRTLEEVGRMLCITKERVRQIEGRALLKLRQAPRARWLAEFAQ